MHRYSQRVRWQCLVAAATMAGFVCCGAAEPLRADEAQAVIERLRGENAELKAQLQLQETVIRNLQESLAVARTESDLFQQRWLEAQARAQTLGAHPGDTEAVAAHRQLLQALRQLTQAQAERQQLAELVQRLVQAIRAGTNLQAEAEAAETVLAGLQQKGNAPSEATAADLPAAQVLDVNPKLRVAVLDVGAEHGLRVGMPLQVLRGDRVIGALRVVEVRPRVSGALIESVRKGLTVRTGDVVRLARTLEVVPQ